MIDNNIMSDDKKKYIKNKKISEVEYKGPKKTFTNSLTPEDIKNLLIGYTETQFNNLHKGYNIRYFSKNLKTGLLEFRMGGMIIIKDDEKGFILCSNGITSWCVQKDAIFYEQEPIHIIKEKLEEKYKAIIFDKNQQIKELKNYIKKLEE